MIISFGPLPKQNHRDFACMHSSYFCVSRLVFVKAETFTFSWRFSQASLYAGAVVSRDDTKTSPAFLLLCGMDALENSISATMYDVYGMVAYKIVHFSTNVLQCWNRQNDEEEYARMF